eukprot:427706-Rhodomonas_salina.1
MDGPRGPPSPSCQNVLLHLDPTEAASQSRSSTPTLRCPAIRFTDPVLGRMHGRRLAVSVH